jgi:hypothetical protein
LVPSSRNTVTSSSASWICAPTTCGLPCGSLLNGLGADRGGRGRGSGRRSGDPGQRRGVLEVDAGDQVGHAQLAGPAAFSSPGRAGIGPELVVRRHERPSTG